MNTPWLFIKVYRDAEEVKGRRLRTTTAMNKVIAGNPK
jgi:hypothetical protein